MGKDPADVQANLTPSGQSFPQSPLMVLFPAPCTCIYVVRLPGARKFIARLDPVGVVSGQANTYQLMYTYHQLRKRKTA